MAPTFPVDFVGQKESRKCWLPQPMGKSRKYSKVHSSGFVPEYRHAVETVGESEGYGCSGRVEAEMTTSYDSCARKRKSISLNVDGCCDSFGVPVQVLSMSKMSRSERKKLAIKLKKELEQIRILQRKGASLSSVAVPVPLSPSSDIRSCSDGLKGLQPQVVHRSVEPLAPQTKKRVSQGHNGAHTKQTASVTNSGEPMDNCFAMLMKQCEKLLERLMLHQFGWVFNSPVDVVALNIPDYFTIIKHPMDLGTVKNKIASGRYSSPSEFAEDVRLTFSNAKKYNPPGHDVHIMADTLNKIFETRWKVLEKKLPVSVAMKAVHPKALDGVKTSPVPAFKKNDVIPEDEKVKSEPVNRVMTAVEKQSLSADLEALLGELPDSIVDFLKEHSGNADQTSEDEIEIDIDALSDDTLFKLRKLLDNYLLEKQKSQTIVEPCEMELLNESGFSNSSMQLCKGNDPVDEDIDVVGGNDPPVSSLPKVEIEENAVLKSSKCSSSGSSSGDSGSSSDSDSDSLSGNELEATKASNPTNVTKGDMGLRENLDLKASRIGDPDIEKQSPTGLAQDVELNSDSEPNVADVDGRQEGESAPPERQVSPEKLYRAALLRNRFADTILKAREKALEKGENRDPEKLRMEREEFERRQREEKARLRAEAKAAEEARKKAEAEAAAEAKRKREVEREAARQALLQMEKTVDINENSQFMEDLEMLRTAQDEQVQSLVEDKSPDLSENGLGSFKLQGSSNPLEQLGLYMKEDEEEEEEEVEPPASAKEAEKDVEEGEID